MAASLATEMSASGIPMYQSGTLPPRAERGTIRFVGALRRLLPSVAIAIATLYGIFIGGAWSGI
jgi:hypothetical protein